MIFLSFHDTREVNMNESCGMKKKKEMEVISAKEVCVDEITLKDFRCTPHMSMS